MLGTRATEVAVFDQDLKEFVASMHLTMDSAGGIGLAANQVGDLRRVFVLHIPLGGEDARYPQRQREWFHDKRFAFINPVITRSAGKNRYQEGCLSFPDIFEFVERPAEVWVSAQDEDGKTFEVHATGILATAIQHELDHIDGVVFIDRMTRLKSQMIRRKIRRRIEMSPDRALEG